MPENTADKNKFDAAAVAEWLADYARQSGSNAIFVTSILRNAAVVLGWPPANTGGSDKSLPTVNRESPDA
jgi:hypothetical protein